MMLENHLVLSVFLLDLANFYHAEILVETQPCFRTQPFSASLPAFLYAFFQHHTHLLIGYSPDPRPRMFKSFILLLLKL